MKPPHISTVEVSLEDLARGVREDMYASLLRQWRTGEMTDEAWERLLSVDEDFREWFRGIGQ